MTKPILKHVFCCILICSSISLSYANNTQMLTNKVSVAGQMNAAKFSQLMRQGFKSVIVNRPDQEMGNVVKVSELRNIAEKSQISVIYQPVNSGKISQTDILEFAKYYNELPKPILMICRSGSRSSALFHQAKFQGLLHE
ncbi:beta-lactamase hydrolase domain-containing protein [Acinetobacter sp. YH12211]|uniref:beta-lactamase hydrolase domain-containing protein n=1 Tax=Acinetobacter sp. YH12211 TaxID=2601147 RepID=UPI0015D2FFFB|nr:sulfur transferase domain-containing protein [Acinetobacter sp. YH12211]